MFSRKSMTPPPPPLPGESIASWFQRAAAQLHDNLPWWARLLRRVKDLKAEHDRLRAAIDKGRIELPSETRMRGWFDKSQP